MWGPSARDVLERVTPDDVTDDGFPFMQARAMRIGGATVLAQRGTYVGELGWELYVEPAWAGQVWDRLMTAGRPSGVRPGGGRAPGGARGGKGDPSIRTDLTVADKRPSHGAS